MCSSLWDESEKAWCLKLQEGFKPGVAAIFSLATRMERVRFALRAGGHGGTNDDDAGTCGTCLAKHGLLGAGNADLRPRQC